MNSAKYECRIFILIKYVWFWKTNIHGKNYRAPETLYKYMQQTFIQGHFIWNVYSERSYKIVIKYIGYALNWGLFCMFIEEYSIRIKIFNKGFSLLFTLVLFYLSKSTFI